MGVVSARSEAGYALFVEALKMPNATYEELRVMWRLANSLVGQRAPADYGEFLAYGYLEGRLEALRPRGTVNDQRRAAGLDPAP